MKKVLVFLDIDGVICTYNSLSRIWESYMGKKWRDVADSDITPADYLKELKLSHPHVDMFDWPFDRDCCDNIHILQRSFPRVKIEYVISSTWRKYFELEELKQIFIYKGLLLNEMRGITDNLGARGDEILKWLKDNNEESTPYIVVDDEVADIKGIVDSDRMVTTRFKTGFDNDKLKDAINKIEKQL